MPDDDIYDGDDDEIGYADAAFLYRNAGWTSPLPVQRNTKSSGLPAGYTGNMGIDPSGADIQAWCEDRPLDNLALRMPDTVIGIDIDAYDNKTGAKTIAEAEKRWGKLPPTVKSTSRDTSSDPNSGIRFFRIPAGMAFEGLISFAELGLGHIEIIQRIHRYAVAWPSIHPNGNTYWWYNSKGQLIAIPNVEDLPELPQKWIEALQKKQKTERFDFGSIEINQCLTEGDPSPRVAQRLRDAIEDINTGSTDSRHDTTNKHVLTLLRYGKDGDPGVAGALKGLLQLYVTAITTGPNARKGATRESARAEFIRMITNPGAAHLLAQPSKDEWMRDLIKETAQQAKAEVLAETRSEKEDVPVVTEPADIPNAKTAPPPPAPTAPTPAPGATKSPLEDIEQGFWESRQSLEEIRDSALAAMASPWAVLAISVARALCLIPPKIKLPPIIGRGGGSLNQFFAVVAKSSGGKGIAAQVAEELVPESINVRPIGTGEGFLAAFNPDTKDPSTWLESIYFDVPEVDQLKNLAGRNGNDVMSIMRQAWSGEGIGYGYADAAKRRYREKHTYRMTMTVSMQPKRAGWLLADEGGGTPQRFMWFPAGGDRRITVASADPNRWVSPLRLAPGASFMYPRTLTVPQQVVDLVLRTREANAQELVDALDGHALFARVKFSYALAVIDGRDEMTDEDWELSGIAAQVSTWTREMVVSEIRNEAVRAAEESGSVRGVEQWAAEIEKRDQREKQIERVTALAIKRLSETPMGMRDLKKSIAQRDRTVVEDVVTTLLAGGSIEWTDVDGKRVLGAVK